jgi:hypothetical protein
VYGIPLIALPALGILGCGVITLAGFAGFSEGNGLGVVGHGIFTLAGAGAILGPDGTAGSAHVTFIPHAGLIMIFLGCVAAGVGGISYLRHTARIRDRSGMTTDDAGGAAGTVTICKVNWMFLRADDAGLLMRNFYGRTRRIAWTEISRFADGSYRNEEHLTRWELLIILRTGKRVRVAGSHAAPAGEVVAAVREAAQPHGIPADLSGIAAKRDGRPAVHGLYRDPGGQPGWRYWDGRHWSPLLPPDISESRADDAPKGPDSWSALPTADGGWTYAAARARFLAVLSAVCAAAAAGLLAWALLIQLGLHRHGHGDPGVGGWLVFGVGAAAFARVASGQWRKRKFFLKLDGAAQRAPRDR